MTTDLKVNRPEPITLKKQIEVYNRSSDLAETIKTLEAGKPILITEFYSNGLTLLKDLKYHLSKKLANTTFKEQREFRATYQKLSNGILLEVEEHNFLVKKAPSIGWIKKLYSETPNFLLSFPQVQGLNSSWQWYENGISIPVLRNKVHPYYGTYFPTRFDHLTLFDNWLKRHEGDKKNAVDVGIGCGILSFLLIKHGFQKVHGTDTNPNAIIGLKEFMGETKLSRKIDLDCASLFGNFKKQTALIVFNPPWLPEKNKSENLDVAIYYNEKLFPAFFSEAKQRLLADGKLVLLFSNLAQITKATREHPIEKELAEGGRFKLERCFKKKVKLASKLTTRDQNWRAEEEVELWELTHA